MPDSEQTREGRRKDQTDVPGKEHVVTYEDCLTGRRQREVWPNAIDATARYEALSQTAFALDVRVEPVRDA